MELMRLKVFVWVKEGEKREGVGVWGRQGGLVAAGGNIVT
jgi:hypothetical protein